MTKKDRYLFIISHFEQSMPEAATELNYRNTFELLCAVMLSAQCTDKRVNLVTPALFEAFPTPSTLANTSKDVIYQYIKSVSYPNNKAEHLVQMAKQLVEKHEGNVPSDFDALVALPGVGRKTANVILSVAFKQAKMAVDTHVFRVSHRIGLVSPKSTTPYAVEQELIKYFPSHVVARAHHWLILHGRYVCTARNPKCDKCGITEICDYYHMQKS